MKKDAIRKELAAVEQSLTLAREKVDSLSQYRETLLYDLCFLEHGITRGSLIRDGKGQVFRVTRLDFRLSYRPWVYGNLRKKDGKTFALRETWVVSWNLDQ